MSTKMNVSCAQRLLHTVSCANRSIGRSSPLQRGLLQRGLLQRCLLQCAVIALSAVFCLADGYADDSNIGDSSSSVESTQRSFSSESRPTLDELNQVTPEDSMVSDGEQSLLRKVLWYLPNRVIDFVDIFKLDIGVGSAAGGVVRATRYGQVGGRVVDPVSVRFGLRGRDFPFFFERESEYGFCSNFTQSSARHVTPLELGIGLDLGVGFYAGISLDEFADFLLGFFLLDLKNDDLVPMF